MYCYILANYIGHNLFNLTRLICFFFLLVNITTVVKKYEGKAVSNLLGIYFITFKRKTNTPW